MRMPMRVLTYLLPLAILVVAVVLRLLDPPFVERGRMLAFDEFQRLYPRTYTDAAVRIADLDDTTLEKFGQWPWPRTQVAALVQRLGELGAAAVALDIVFAEPDRTSPSNILPIWQQYAKLGPSAGDNTTQNGNGAELARLFAGLPDHDTVLAKAITEIPVVTGFVLVPQPTERQATLRAGFAMAGDDPRPFLPNFAGAVTSLPILQESAAGNGSLNQVPESDGIVRRAPLMLAAGEQIYPTLAIEALRAAFGAKTFIIKASGASGEKAFGAKTGLSSVKVGQFAVPTDANGRIWLHFTATAPERTLPIWKLFEPDFDPAPIEGSIVFIGTSAAGLKDLRATPLDPAMPGVEVHASIAEQILLGSYINRPDWMGGAEIAYLAVLGLALIVLLPRWGSLICAAIALVAITGGVAAAAQAFLQLGYLVDPVYPGLVVVMIYLSSSLIMYLRTETEKRQVRGAFSRYLNPALLQQLADDPTRLKLGGETRNMTILFSDIRGFTGISEQFDAEGLTRFINRFLTPMTNIILERRGTIDKYMGDCIMAFWNAPLDDPDHAKHAALSALTMEREVAAFNVMLKAESVEANRQHIPVNVGIGLNSGDCCVGNMGSDLRFDYSVLGDDVNLASRLEGQSKNYAVTIVIGENTAAQLPGHALLELDKIQVKGKTRPVRIFTLYGDEAMRADPAFSQPAEKHQRLIEVFRAQKWDEADALIGELRPQFQRMDGFYDLYEERIADYRANPPPTDWDGTYIATSK